MTTQALATKKKKHPKMGNQKIPDAWDEDWEQQADREARAEERDPPAAQAPKTKAERWAEHRELNRQIWEAAYVFQFPTTAAVWNHSYLHTSSVRLPRRCTT